MRVRRKFRRSRGTTLAEAAIVLSVLCMLTLGTIKYGWLFVRVHQTTNAAREGARRAILPSANLSEVTTAVATVMTAAGIPAGGYTVNVTPDPGAAAAGSEVEVTITLPVTTAGVDLLPGYLFAPDHLTARVVMAKEG